MNDRAVPTNISSAQRHLRSVAVVAIFAALAAGSLDKGSASSSKSGTDDSKSAKDDDAPAIDVAATELFDAYHENEVAADERFKSKKLRVTGTVTSIDKDFLDNIVVRLQTANQFQSVMATVREAEKSAAAKLKKGQKLTVVCKGRGMVVGSPSLDDCAFE